MARHSALTLAGVIVMVALIVGLDVSLLRHHFALRLAANVAIVVGFGLLYLVVRSRS